MDAVQLLYDFMDRVCEDPRAGPAHISLYLALLCNYKRQGFHDPIYITGTILRKQAKIGGTGTYHRCLRDLCELGYIRYEPSCNPAIGSQVHLIFPSGN
jgi:hypothetical protein